MIERNRTCNEDDRNLDDDVRIYVFLRLDNKALTPWLILRIAVFWSVGPVSVRQLSEKWYAAGMRTAPTLMLKREE